MNRIDAAFLRAHRVDALTRQAGHCHYCLEPMSVRLATADHRVPRSKGGSNHRDNIAAACVHCNQAKASMDEKKFLAILRSETVPVVSWPLQRAWMRRRVWVRTHLACRRISASVGIKYAGPKAGR